jgi:hypothetical protein
MSSTVGSSVALPQRSGNGGIMGSIAFALLAVDAVLAGVIAALFVWVSVGLVVDSTTAASDTWVNLLDAASTVLGLASLATAVAYLIWLYRAVARVRMLGPGVPVASPWMAVIWWFVPFAWFVMPYRVIRDLLARSAPDDHTFGGRLVALWWTAWLVSLVLYAITLVVTDMINTVGEAQGLALLALAYSLSLLTAAVLAAITVRVISRGQQRLLADSDQPVSSSGLPS